MILIQLLLSTILISSLFILVSHHPIYCLFSLILTFINFSILLIYVNLEFLALSYIIVYVGAICVLFIFVILLLNIRVYNLTDNRESFWWLSTSVLTSICLFFIYIKFPLIDMIGSPNEIILQKGDILLFGKTLFNYNWQYLILTILLLLLAVISTIAVSLKKSKNKQINFTFFQ